MDEHGGNSGAYVLDTGDEALLARAWMVQNAVEGIDILTFIWSFDNVGMIATDALLRAAERGVQVRVLVDDLVLDDEHLDLLLALDAHPLFAIRIYNPVETVGVSHLETVATLLTDLRRFNLEVERQIEAEMAPENSWNPRLENPDRQAGWWRLVRMWMLRFLPIRAFL